MENSLEKILNVSVKKLNKSISGGCINNGSVYQTEENQLFFVKENSKLGVIFVQYYLIFCHITYKYSQNLCFCISLLSMYYAVSYDLKMWIINS